MQIRETVVKEIKSIINDAKAGALRNIESNRTMMYWHLGKKIFEEEQGAKDRAKYGSYLMKYLSERLQPEFGSGFSYRQLSYYRKFYITFPIVHTLRAQLVWTQYKMLLTIDNQDKREFYIAESIHNNWTTRQLERQIGSGLYERLLMSNDKENVLAIARKERHPTSAKEIIKDPILLEFLGLKPDSDYYEKDLEKAIINHLQDFMLELGNGFSFVARQKRINIEGDDFFIDLVFYNRLLRCFVIIDIKTGKLTHQDLGQLQMYVNYYNRIEKLVEENETIGILLCASKNDSVVKFTLPENEKHILASQYQIYIPSEKQLLEELKKEVERFNLKY